MRRRCGRSLELFRNSLKDVRLVTFDELLEKLQILRELLAGERYVSNVPDEDDDEPFMFEEDEDDGWAEFDGPDDEDRDPAN